MSRKFLDNTNMTVDQIIRYYGSKERAAAEIGLSVDALRKWRSRGIPLSRQVAIAALTNNALKVAKGGRNIASRKS